MLPRDGRRHVVGVAVERVELAKEANVETKREVCLVHQPRGEAVGQRQAVERLRLVLLARSELLEDLRLREQESSIPYRPWARRKRWRG